MQNWEAALEDLTRLWETIDNNVSEHSSEQMKSILACFISDRIRHIEIK